jgi:hypothetical protein
MLGIVVWVISLVGIPGAGEKIPLPGDSTALHMHAVNKVMLEIGSAPIAAPD